MIINLKTGEKLEFNQMTDEQIAHIPLNSMQICRIIDLGLGFGENACRNPQVT